MKRIMILMLVGFAFLATVFSLYQYFSGTALNQAVLSPELAIEPQPTDMKVRVNLYFPHENKLRIEERIVTVTQERLEEAIAQELQKGPKNLAFTDLFSGDVSILDVRVSNNVAYVNLSEAFLDQNYVANEKSELFVWSIVNSFTEIDDVYRVQILIEGRRRDVQIGNSNLYQLLTRNRSFIYEERRYPSSSVIEFVEAISERRYDLAYTYLTAESQEKYPYEEFKAAADRHFESFNGYRRTIHFTQGFTDSWIVYIKYDSADRTDEEAAVSRFDLWEVVQVEEDWKIVFNK